MDVLALPAAISSQAYDMRGTIDDHLPGNATGPVGSVDDAYKFDEGFYDKIRVMMNTEAQSEAPNVHDGKIYHDIIFLFQSGGDPGRINEINPTTGLLVQQFTSLIDEPYGIDSDSAGNLYVANTDDNNIVRISPAGASTVFATGGLDDPRGVAVGPKYTAPVATAGDGTDGQSSHAHSNDGPSIALQNATHDIPFRTELARNSTTIYTITAEDPEGDQITFDLVPHAIKSGTISISDHRNATSTLSINTSGMDAGTYAFVITASDGHNIERAVYTVVVR